MDVCQQGSVAISWTDVEDSKRNTAKNYEKDLLFLSTIYSHSDKMRGM